MLALCMQMQHPALLWVLLQFELVSDDLEILMIAYASFSRRRRNYRVGRYCGPWIPWMRRC